MNRIDAKIFRQIREELSPGRLPYTLIGAAAYGSRVRDDYNAESDFDLLVVASGIHPKRQRRGEEILLLKKLLPPAPFDILLLTPEEASANFRNHNPLFLDIATEGIILFDSDNFLENLMEETKDYLENSEIRKIEGGWVFPVKPGEPTYLSKVSNKDFSYAMLRDGERDLAIGKKLIEETFFDKAVYHFQQAVEKFITSILIALGIFGKTHFVGKMLREHVEKGDVPERWKQDLLEAANISESIEPEVTLSRYPGIMEDSLWLPCEEYEKEDSDKALRKAEKVLSIAKHFIDDWFSDKPTDSAQ